MPGYTRTVFFGCRAYGLWSPVYYEDLARRSREAKKRFQQQWEKLGVSLPREVVEFQVPYCRSVQIADKCEIDDAGLLDVAESIEGRSRIFCPWYGCFREQYFSDLSFLFTSLVFGMQGAARMKFDLVREILATGKEDRLEEVLERLPDLCAF